MVKAFVTKATNTLIGLEVEVLTKVPLAYKDVFLTYYSGEYYVFEEEQLTFIDGSKPITQLEAFIGNMRHLSQEKSLLHPFIVYTEKLAIEFKDKRGSGYERV